MLEELASSGLWSAFCEIVELKPSLTLKLQYRTPAYQAKLEAGEMAEKFLNGASFRTQWDLLPRMDFRSRPMRYGSPERSAWVWFVENDAKIAKAFIRDVYAGDWTRAMSENDNFDDLHEKYLSYFRERRERFLDKEKQIIAIQQKALENTRKAPASHGGVANLLKVLTKTMQQQGASILSIAKMQYAVCTQAGILLPNEFLVDVLVADQIIADDNERR